MGLGYGRCMTLLTVGDMPRQYLGTSTLMTVLYSLGHSGGPGSVFLKLLITVRSSFRRPSRGLNILNPLEIKTLYALSLKSDGCFSGFLVLLLRSPPWF